MAISKRWFSTTSLLPGRATGSVVGVLAVVVRFTDERYDARVVIPRLDLQRNRNDQI